MVLIFARGTSLPFNRRNSCDPLDADYRNPDLPLQVPEKKGSGVILNPQADLCGRGVGIPRLL